VKGESCLHVTRIKVIEVARRENADNLNISVNRVRMEEVE
jgi:hypothetical protein